MDETELTDNKVSKPWLFQKGEDERRNLAGRPVGSISPITRVKQIFEENPEKFADFIEEYIKDPANRKHIVEMIDGKAKQPISNADGEPFVMNLIKYERDNNSV